jgi:hypothetical protein
MKRFGEWVESLFEEHKLVRRLVVLWAVGLITFVIYVTFSDLTLLTASVAAAVGTVVGILSVVINFYTRSRELDDVLDREEK